LQLLTGKIEARILIGRILKLDQLVVWVVKAAVFNLSSAQMGEVKKYF
jgi:hypothetical protein